MNPFIAHAVKRPFGGKSNVERNSAIKEPFGGKKQRLTKLCPASGSAYYGRLGAYKSGNPLNLRLPSTKNNNAHNTAQR